MLNHLDSLAQALVEAAIENGIRPRDLMGIDPKPGMNMNTIEERIAALAYEPDVAKAIALIESKGGTVVRDFLASPLPVGRATAMAVALCSLVSTLQGQIALGKAIGAAPKHAGPTLGGEPIVPGMKAVTSSGEVTVLGVHGPEQSGDYLIVYQYNGGSLGYIFAGRDPDWLKPLPKQKVTAFHHLLQGKPVLPGSRLVWEGANQRTEFEVAGTQDNGDLVDTVGRIWRFGGAESAYSWQTPDVEEIAP